MLNSNAIAVIIGLFGFCSAEDTTFTFTPNSLTSQFGDVTLLRSDAIVVDNGGGDVYWYMEGDSNQVPIEMALVARVFSDQDECEPNKFSVHFDATHTSTEGDGAIIISAGSEYISFMFDFDGGVIISDTYTGGSGIYPACGSSTLPTIPNDSTDAGDLFDDSTDTNTLNDDSFYNWRDRLAGGDRANWNVFNSARVGNNAGGFSVGYELDTDSNTMKVTFMAYDASGTSTYTADCTFNTVWSFEHGSDVQVYFSPDYHDPEVWEIRGLTVTTDCTSGTLQPSSSPTPDACDNTQDVCCEARGDPHYTTFDGLRHHFQGVGYYDYVFPCTDDDYLPFRISARQEECGRWAPKTCIFEVRVTVEDGSGDVIVFPQDGSTPYYLADSSDATGTHNNADGSGSYTISNKNFVGTFYDDRSNGEVTISLTYRGTILKIKTSDDCMSDRICGLCGKLDGDGTNDFTQRDGTELSTTSNKYANTFTFGDTWCNEDYTNNPDCEPTDVDSNPEPSDECILAAEEYCENLYDLYCSECTTDELNVFDWLYDCAFDACSATNDDITDYDLTSAINAGIFNTALESCSFSCDNIDPDGRDGIFETQCYSCATQCTTLTDAPFYGCAFNDCLSTCKGCIEDIPWDDYNDGQSSQCQCHENGCDQCPNDWFKLDYDFPCQSCDGLIGCMHCTDFRGCQQCESGYTLVEHPSCGDNSLLNTGNTPFYYCQEQGSNSETCTIDITEEWEGGDITNGGGNNGGGCFTLEAGSCQEDPNCSNCANWGGCNQCADGYFYEAHGYKCVSIDQNFGGNCLQATNWQGCTSCDNGFNPTWDSSCGSGGAMICA